MVVELYRSPLHLRLMVGIGEGVPSEENDIRLGHVVVSKPVGPVSQNFSLDFAGHFWWTTKAHIA